MHRRPLAMILAASLLFAACANDSDPEPSAIGDDVEETGVETGSADEPDEVEPGEPEDEIDVTVVPDEITEDYVEAVLAELEQIRHEALVEFRENDGEMTIEVMDLTASAFTQDEVEYERAGLTQMADRDFEGHLPVDQLLPFEPQVDSLLETTPECVFVETTISREVLLEDPPEPSTRLYYLTIRDRELVEDYNPTPWVIAMIPANVDHWREEQPCAE